MFTRPRLTVCFVAIAMGLATMQTGVTLAVLESAGPDAIDRLVESGLTNNSTTMTMLLVK